jgi:hypothetical protein
MLHRNDLQVTRQCMKIIIFILIVFFRNEPLYSQDYNQAFNHSVTDTIQNFTDTVSINPSRKLIFQTVTLNDTDASTNQLEYYKIIKIINPVDGHLVQEIADSGHSNHEIEFVDFNSDGYKDIMIHEDMYNMLLPSSVWLFNPKNNQFRYSKELSGMSELSIDYDGTISSQSLSTGGKGGDYCKYRFENDTLKLTEEVSSNFFDYEKKVLVDDEIKTVELDESDDSQNFKTVISKRMMFDSLRIVKKIIIKDGYGIDITAITKDAIIDEPFGTFILLEEHDYQYKIKSHGKLAIHEIIKKLVKNKFKIINKDYME